MQSCGEQTEVGGTNKFLVEYCESIVERLDEVQASAKVKQQQCLGLKDEIHHNQKALSMLKFKPPPFKELSSREKELKKILDEAQEKLRQAQREYKAETATGTQLKPVVEAAMAVLVFLKQEDAFEAHEKAAVLQRKRIEQGLALLDATPTPSTAQQHNLLEMLKMYNEGARARQARYDGYLQSMGGKMQAIERLRVELARARQTASDAAKENTRELPLRSPRKRGAMKNC